MKNTVRHDDQSFLDLLQRWLRGDFRRSDENELRQLTDADDFRREAAQGFFENADANHDRAIQSLRQRLAERTGRHSSENLRPVWVANLMAAAALLVLVLGAVWFFQNQNFGDSKTVASARETVENQEIVAAPVQNSEDESAPPLSAIPPFLRENEDAKTAKKSASRRSDAVLDDPENLKDLATADDSDLSKNMPSGAGDRAAENSPAEVFSASEKMSDAAAASGVAAAPPPVAAKPEAENFSKINSDAAKKEVPAKAIPQTTSAPAAKRKHNTDAKPNLDELRKNQKLPAKAAPVGGWDAFEEYIRQNARLPIEARERNISGTVVLQFSPLPTGETGAITTLRSLGGGCDEEARRLVQLFDWEMGLDNLVKVEIRFVR